MGNGIKLDAQLPVIHSMGNLIFDPAWSMKAHKSGNCELLHIISGSVCLIMRRRKIMAHAGDTLLVPSNTMHRDEFDFDKGLKVFMVHFSWKCEKDYFSRLSFMDLPVLPLPKKESIASLIQGFRCDFSGAATSRDFIIRIRLSEILLRMLAVSGKELEGANGSARNDTDKQHRDWIVGKVKSYLEENYSHPVSLEEISRHVGMSPFHLCHIFSNDNNFTIFEFLTQLRMSKARILLEKGKLSISETAYAVGFNNSNYFSKVFHRFFGFPPNRMHRKDFSFRKNCFSSIYN